MSAQHNISPLQPARSALRMATQRVAGRHRRYALRLLVIVLCFALLAGLVWLVYSRIFAPDSAVYPLYWLHDHVYLPLYGRMWTALFPYAMLWVIPLLLLILLLLGEFLLPHSPVRALHRWLVRTLITLPVGRSLVALLPGGFARRVLDESLTTGMGELMLMRNALTSVSDMKLSHLARLVALRWHLSPKGALDELALFEDTALLRLRAKPGFGALKPLARAHQSLPSPSAMSKEFALLLAEDSAAKTTADAYGFLAKLNTPPDHLADVTETPLDLAALAIRVAKLGARRRSPAGGMFFAGWARAMSDRNRPEIAARLVQAQRLIRFEFWAAITDHPRRMAPFDDALALALITHPETPDRGEHFAWRGEV